MLPEGNSARAPGTTVRGSRRKLESEYYFQSMFIVNVQFRCSSSMLAEGTGMREPINGRVAKMMMRIRRGWALRYVGQGGRLRWPGARLAPIFTSGPTISRPNRPA